MTAPTERRTGQATPLLSLGILKAESSAWSCICTVTEEAANLGLAASDRLSWLTCCKV